MWLLKAIDRLDNMYRAFAIPDSKYHERLFGENEQLYSRIFLEEEKLAPFREIFSSLGRLLKQHSKAIEGIFN